MVDLPTPISPIGDIIVLSWVKVSVPGDFWPLFFSISPTKAINSQHSFANYLFFAEIIKFFMLIKNIMVLISLFYLCIYFCYTFPLKARRSLQKEI